MLTAQCSPDSSSFARARAAEKCPPPTREYTTSARRVGRTTFAAAPLVTSLWVAVLKEPVTAQES